MKKQIIDQYMTRSPHTINAGVPLKTVRQLMKKFGIRHFPVQVAGRLVGVISDRDLKLAASYDKDGKLLVDDVMSPEAYAVAPGTPLKEVAGVMAENRYGCAVVQQEGGKVVGIFTAVDGLRAISEGLGEKKRAAKPRKGSTI